MIRSVLGAICLTISFSIMTTSVVTADESPNVKVGQPAPDFKVTGIDGKTFKLSDQLVAGDRNIVLIFSRANW